jgi:D-2-hydroxyacid dehydrogenase (NADP+)
MTAPSIVYIGAPEADASAFERRVRADLPGAAVFATNDRGAALEQLSHAEAVIGHHFQFDEDLLARAPRLRWIQSLTTGTDAITKLEGLRPEVAVTSTRGMHGPQMSELVFLQMLALARDFPRMLANQHRQVWDRWPQPLLWNKTVVIVGVGAIAEALAVRSQAFGMRVHGVSASGRQPHGFDAMHPRERLPAAAAQADFLVLVVPLSQQTRNLVDAKVLAAMKPAAFLINVARGGVLDEEALVAALQAGRIAGAALDVFRQQPLPPGHPLWRLPNVIITPLVGGMSDVYLDQAYPVVLHNLQAWLSGRPEQMRNVVERARAP